MSSELIITCDICKDKTSPLSESIHHTLIYDPTRTVCILLYGNDLDQIPGGEEKIKELGWAMEDCHVWCGTKKINDLMLIEREKEVTVTPGDGVDWNV